MPLAELIMANIQKFMLFPNIATLSKFQREEYAKLWFDLGKICIGSLVIKIFEPGGPHLDLRSFLTIIFGLTSFWLCVRLGLHIGGERKQ